LKARAEKTEKPVSAKAATEPKPAPSVEKAPPAAKPAPPTERAAPPAPNPTPPMAEKTAPPKPAPPATAAAPSGEGDFTVQIAALNARAEADSIVRRLTSKGYAAYIVPPGNGAVMYRVRVGRFKTRRDAEPTAARLQREEQYKPWITR